MVKKDKVKRQEQRGDKQLEKPKKMPQQPSNPATQQPDDQIIHPFLFACSLVAQQTTMGKHNNILFKKKKNLLVLQLGQAFLPLPGQHSNLISVLRGRFSIQADTLERLQERDE